MSYTVQYGSCRYDKVKPRHRNIKSLILISFLAVVLLLSVLFPAQLAQIRSHVLPFLEPEVLEAFSEMTSNISKGTSMQDAAVVFCREVIGGASY